MTRSYVCPSSFSQATKKDLVVESAPYRGGDILHAFVEQLAKLFEASIEAVRQNGHSLNCICFFATGKPMK